MRKVIGLMPRDILYKMYLPGEFVSLPAKHVNAHDNCIYLNVFKMRSALLLLSSWVLSHLSDAGFSCWNSSCYWLTEQRGIQWNSMSQALETSSLPGLPSSSFPSFHFALPMMLALPLPSTQATSVAWMWNSGKKPLRKYGQGTCTEFEFFI